MSLPLLFWRWDVHRAATLRVLGRLWEFCDRDLDDGWCFRTDAELIEDCGLGGERQLRMCLRDMREAGLVAREIGTDGRRGFRLYNRDPYAKTLPEAMQGRPSKTGKIKPERSNRKEVTGKVASRNRKEVVAKPERCFRTTLLESRENRITEADDAFGLELVSAAKAPKQPPPRPQFTASQRRDIRTVFAALCAARDCNSNRNLGKPATKIRLVSREDFIAKAIVRHGVAALVESLGNRGDIGGATALGILTNLATPFRSEQVKLGLDRDELTRLAANDVGDEPRTTRTTPKIRL